MTDLNAYEQWRQQSQKQTAARASVLLYSLEGTNPDEHAADLALGKAFNIPASVASAGRDQLGSRLRDLKTSSILQRSPLLAQWLSNEDNAKVAYDDVDNLGWFEGFARGAKNSVKRGGSRLNQIGAQSLMEQSAQRYQDSGKTFLELVDSETYSVGGQSFPSAWGRYDPASWVGAAGRWLDVQHSRLFGVDDKERAKDFAESISKSLKYQSERGLSATASGFQDAWKAGDTLGETFVNLAKASASNPVGAISWALETAGESAPVLAAAAGMTVATKNPGAGLDTMAVGSYLTERYTSPIDFLKAKGIDINNPQDVERIVTDPTLLKEAADKGVIRGAIIAMFDRLSGGLAGKTLAANPIVESIAQTIQQAVTGMLGEYSGRVATGQPVDWNDIVAEGVVEMATTPVEMGIAGHELYKKRQKAKAAETTQAKLDALSQAAAASKLKQRPGGAFEDYLNTVTTGTDVQDVFVPAKVFQTYFQGSGIEPQTFWHDLYGSDAFDDYTAALATGGDVKIPTGTYAAKIVGTDLEPMLREHIRFNPEDMTAAEAADFNGKAEAALQEAFDQAEEARRYESELQAYETKIYDEMVHRLMAAGRSADVARNEAMVYPAFFKAMAARSGLSVEEFALRFTLPQVRGELAQGMQLKDVGEIDRALIEARQPAKTVAGGQSLMEWLDAYGGVNDPGGELSARDLAVVKRGKGKKTLRLARKMKGDLARHSMDIVAQAAVEAGFMANDSRVQAWKKSLADGTEAPDLISAFLDAIAADASGDNKPGNDRVDNFLAYLDSLGLSLANSDEEIKAAVKADQERQGREFRQEDSRIIDPLLDPKGAWREGEVTAVLEDGEEVKVHAGDVVDHLLERIKAAEEILTCLNAA